MILLAYLACFAAAFYMLFTYVREHLRESAAKRAACPHSHTRIVNAWGDPRFPSLHCDDCGKQVPQKTPVPCPHCGGNVNKWEGL